VAVAFGDGALVATAQDGHLTTWTMDGIRQIATIAGDSRYSQALTEVAKQQYLGNLTQSVPDCG
jgi:hypothetical protein